MLRHRGQKRQHLAEFTESKHLRSINTEFCMATFYDLWNSRYLLHKADSGNGNHPIILLKADCSNNICVFFSKKIIDFGEVSNTYEPVQPRW